MRHGYPTFGDGVTVTILNNRFPGTVVRIDKLADRLWFKYDKYIFNGTEYEYYMDRTAQDVEAYMDNVGHWRLVNNNSIISMNYRTVKLGGAND
jgi:hypothetical protein